MYICRARIGGSITPGKWVKGNCNIAFGGKEQVMNQYQVAYGNAIWQPYSSTQYGLLRTADDRDGSPLYSCRFTTTQASCKAIRDTSPANWRMVCAAFPSEAPNSSSIRPSTLSTGTEDIIHIRLILLTLRGRHNLHNPTPDASTVTWRSARAGDTPGPGAIEGGPGNGPEPGAPLYVCRAGGTTGGLFPGKWIQGKCSIAFNGGDFKQGKYDVAYGSATWAPFGGSITPDMVQGGYDLDQTPLYICRVQNFKPSFGGDKGNQPGFLKNSACLVGYGSTFTINPPFEVLFNAPPNAPAAGDSGGSTTNGIIVSFDSGTSGTPGTLTVTNGASGQVVVRQLAANMTAQQCLTVLQQAALDAGIQIQTDAAASNWLARTIPSRSPAPM